MCGGLTIPWDLIRWTAVQYQRLLEVQLDGVSPSTERLRSTKGPFLITAIEEARKEMSETLSILVVLCRHRSGKASDERDRVYALLGLSRSRFKSLNIRPRYDLEPRIVYHEVAVAILMTERNLNILSVTCSRTASELSKRPKLPSWVPDWSQVPQVKPLLEMSPRWRTHLAAEPDHDVWEPTFSEDLRLIKIQGFHVDAIDQAVSIPMNEDELDGRQMSFFEFHLRRARRLKGRETTSRALDGILDIQHAQPYKGSGLSRAAIAQEVLCAAYREIGADEAFARQRRQHQITGRLHIMSQFVPIYLLLSVWMALSTWFASKVGHRRPVSSREPDFPASDRSAGRLAFKTRDGYIGMGPADARVGDPITLCKGSKMPLILRKRSTTFELIGDCYVLGIMRGERWDATCCEEMWIE